MATLNASIWLLIQEHADPAQIYEKFISVYRTEEQIDFLWLYLYYSTQADHEPLVVSILDRTTNDINSICHLLTKEQMTTCLNEAIRKDNHVLMRTFLDHDPDLCSTVASFYTAENRYKLTYCPIGLAIHWDKADSLQLLMEYYNGETIGDGRETPLHLATRYPTNTCVRLLLSNDAAVAHLNSKDADGWTPLLYAAMYHPDAIPELLAHGADPSASVDKSGNALQILSNWSIRLRLTSWGGGEHDPCPTLARRRTAPSVTEDAVYLPDGFVALAQAAVEYGVDANADSTPLANFAVNVHRRADELRDNIDLRRIFDKSMAYLTDVSDQAVRDVSLLKLCHAVNFVATQLRRCHDYDNMLGYMDMLSFIGGLMAGLLARGANGDAKEPARSGEKKIRAFQFLLPYAHPCCAALKRLAAVEFGDQLVAESTRYNSTMDVLFVAILAMYSLGVDEPDLYKRAVGTVVDMMVGLVGSGARCWQTLHFFTCLCIDPEVGIPILHRYLNCHSQLDYHHMLSAMQRYLSVLSSEELAPFDAIRQEVAKCQNRIYTLKQLVRRELVASLGGWQQLDKVSALPLPPTLKSYLIS